MNVESILKQKGSKVITIPPDTRIGVAAHRLRLERIGAVVIADASRTIRGILSERDIVYGLTEHGPRIMDMPVSDIMSHHVLTCGPDASIASIMRMMIQHRIRHVPVVSRDSLIGIVSIGDIVKSRLEDMELETSVLRDYAVAHH